MAQQRNRDDFGYPRGNEQRGGQQRDYDDDYRRGRREYGSSNDFGTQYETSGMGRGREQWRQSEDDDMGWDQGGRNGGYSGQGVYGQGSRGEFERGGYGQGGYGSQRDYGRGSQGSSATRQGSSAYGAGGFGSQDTQGTWGQGGFGGYSENHENQSGFGGSRYGQSGSGRMQQGAHRGQHNIQGVYGGQGDDQSGVGGTQQRRGSRGPKGYKRSDERIKEEVCERLWAMDVDASEVTLEVQDGKVKLEGTVPERWMKHSIEDIADECWGVQDVDNRIRVQAQSGESGSASQGGAAGGNSSSSNNAGGRSGKKE